MNCNMIEHPVEKFMIESEIPINQKLIRLNNL